MEIRVNYCVILNNNNAEVTKTHILFYANFQQLNLLIFTPILLNYMLNIYNIETRIINIFKLYFKNISIYIIASI